MLHPTNNISPYNESKSKPPTFTIPPHLMGRNIQNPTSDTSSLGRRLQKPRPGVRVPYRNLTSQIVTQEEIAQEIFQRSLKKHSSSSTSSGILEKEKTISTSFEGRSDTVFAMRLSQRLANSLSSPQKDVEREPLGDHRDILCKMKAEFNGETKCRVSQGSADKDKKSLIEVQNCSNVAVVPQGAASQSSCQTLVRQSWPIVRLDRITEREIALKQLSELPKIKGGARELWSETDKINFDSGMELNCKVLMSSCINHNEKQDVIKPMEGNNEFYTGAVIPKKPSFLSNGQNSEKVPSISPSKLVLSDIESKNQVSEIKNVMKNFQNKLHRYNFEKKDKEQKESKLQINKTIKSNVQKVYSNALNKKLAKKRRSLRLEIARIKMAQINAVSKSKTFNKKEKRRKHKIGKKKEERFIFAKKTVDSETLELNSPLEKPFSCSQQKSSNNCLSSQEENNLHPPLETEVGLAKILKYSLNDDDTDAACFDNVKSKENGICKNGEKSTNVGCKEPSPKTECKDSAKGTSRGCKRLNELDSLFIDEGAINLLLEVSPLNEDIIKPKRAKITLKRELGKLNKQNMNIKANLVKKSVLLDSDLSSRPKRKVKREQKNEAIELIDLSDSPIRKSPVSLKAPLRKVLFPVEAETPEDVVRRHSSGDLQLSCSDGLDGTIDDSTAKSICCKSRTTAQDKSPSHSVVKTNRMPVIDLERVDFVRMKNDVTPTKQNCARHSNTRKSLPVPRMSNAVRMKLNSEMSKEFERGLDLKQVKCVAQKTSKIKKREGNVPLKVLSEQITPKKQEKCVSIKIESPTRSNLKNSSPKSKRSKSLECLNVKELSVCINKLSDVKENSVNAINDRSKKVEVISEPKVSVESCSNDSEALPKVKVEAAKKEKKSKDSSVSSFKHLIDKEHRIISVPLSPIAASYNGIVTSLKSVSPKYKKKNASKFGKQNEPKHCVRQRFSGRPNAGTYNFKEINLRRYENFVQIILTPASTTMKNSLNVQVLHEFRDALQQLRRDRFCRVVLVTSTGSSFCQGVDLQALIHNNIEHRKRAAEEMSRALKIYNDFISLLKDGGWYLSMHHQHVLTVGSRKGVFHLITSALLLFAKDFVKVLAMFNKPIIAGVQGATFGLGVTMLPFFDVVYASDKATFHTPYARLGQVAEGAAVLTFPLLLGNTMTSELLFGSRRLTAGEALNSGLVTRVLWPEKFQEELIPNVKVMANQSTQSMESMKALLRLNLRVKLDATLDSESSLLVQHWCSPECQRNFRKFLDTSDDIFFQRQKRDPN